MQHKVLLVLNNGRGTSFDLANIEADFPADVVFIPLNSISLLQPIDQGVAFKSYYLQRTISQLIRETGSDEKSIR